MARGFAADVRKAAAQLRLHSQHVLFPTLQSRWLDYAARFDSSQAAEASVPGSPWMERINADKDP